MPILEGRRFRCGDRSFGKWVHVSLSGFGLGDVAWRLFGVGFRGRLSWIWIPVSVSHSVTVCHVTAETTLFNGGPVVELDDDSSTKTTEGVFVAPNSPTKLLFASTEPTGIAFVHIRPYLALEVRWQDLSR